MKKKSGLPFECIDIIGVTENGYEKVLAGITDIPGNTVVSYGMDGINTSELDSDGGIIDVVLDASQFGKEMSKIKIRLFRVKRGS